MGTNEVIFERCQAALEDTRGTPKAATRKVYFMEASYELGRELSSIAVMNGTQFKKQVAAQGRVDVGFRTTEALTFEDTPWTLEHFLRGGLPAPTGDAGAPPAYTRDYVPTLAADDLKSSTWEIGEPSIVHRASQVMGRQLDIRIDPDNQQQPYWLATGQWFARDFVPGSFTAALTDRTTEAIPAPGTQLFVDTSSPIGTTPVLGRFINASISLRPNRYGKAFGEDRKWIAANKVGIEEGGFEFDAQIAYEFDARTELDWFLGDTPQLVKARLQADGSQIHGGTVVNKRSRLDLVGYMGSWVRGRRRGNLIATMGLTGFYDPVSGQSTSWQIVNGIAGAIA